MKSSDFQLLIWKKLRGETSESENHALADWLNQSTENQQLADKIETIWQSFDAAPTEFAVDLDAEFLDLKKRIAQEKAEPMRVVRGGKFEIPWRRAAAAVAILAVAVWGFRQISSPAKIQMQTVFAKTTEKVALPDGSKVWLREGSTLEFPEKFSQNSRSVSLTGEAFFEVEHDVLHPFKIQNSDGSTVEVLGTAFNISTPENAPATEVFVKTGRVRFAHAGSKTAAILEAGQKSIFDHNTLKVKVLKAETSNDLAWQTGGLSFENTPVSQVILDFEKFYGVEISLKNFALVDCKYTSPLNNQPAEKALEALALAFGMTVKKLGEKEFEMFGGKCR